MSAPTLVGQLELALRADDLARAEALVRLWLTNGAGFGALCDRALRPALRRAAADPCTGRQVALLGHALVTRLRRPAPQPSSRRVATAVPLDSLAGVEALMLGAALERDGWRLAVLGSGDVVGEPVPDALVVGPVRRGLPATVVVSVCDDPAADLALRGVEETQQALVRMVTGATDLDVAVLALVAAGRTNKEIARELELAPSTVKSRLDRLFARLGVPDRAAAAAVAVRQGWI